MALRAAFFDVGDTLVEGWLPQGALVRQALVEAFGDRHWFDALIAAEIVPRDQADPHRQETNRWYDRWFDAQGIACDIEIDRLRSAFAVPLDLVSTPVPGAHEAVRWCKQQGLAVVLVTNTLSRGDTEVLRDWQRAGLADAIDAVVSSHDVGWQKPHPAMFERALALAGVAPGEAFMVGDNLEADIRGAQQVGLRAVWRRTNDVAPPADLRPDAVIRTLLELPLAIAPWL
ncbi:MAG TPA: HAD family hydrolase [Candidatus Limnocylindria bacterium]|nr:HAD family hydrolase [Candidatus Limnocylindria bacterium]